MSGVRKWFNDTISHFRDIKFEPPYPVDSQKSDLHYTYLDTIGRPILEVTKRNLVENHIEDFTISYSFNSIMLLQEPMLLFTAFFILFVVVIIVVRLDFSIVEVSVSTCTNR